MFTKKNFLKNTFDKNVQYFQKLLLNVIFYILRHFVNCNPFYFCNVTKVMFLIKIDIQQRNKYSLGCFHQ